jgi:hypothetical protein
VCTALVLAGCGDDTPDVTRPEKINVAPDLSKAADAYVALGVPAPTQKWTIDQLEAAGNAIAKLSDDKALELPRYRSAKSGALFDHILAAQDLAALNDASAELFPKAATAYRAFLVYRQMMASYAGQTSGGRSFDAEVVELAGAALKMYAKYLSFAKPYAAGIPADAADREQKLAPLAEAKAQLAPTIKVIVDTYKVEFQEQYRVDALTRLAGYLAESLPALMGELEAATQTEIRKLLKVFADFEADPTLKAALQRALDAAG